MCVYLDLHENFLFILEQLFHSCETNYRLKIINVCRQLIINLVKTNSSILSLNISLWLVLFELFDSYWISLVLLETLPIYSSNLQQPHLVSFQFGKKKDFVNYLLNILRCLNNWASMITDCLLWWYFDAYISINSSFSRIIVSHFQNECWELHK